MPELNTIQDQSGDRKYFVITPQIVWALSRTPYDYMLWSAIKMVVGESGTCKLGTRDLAIIAKMSTGKVQDSRAYLLAQGLLEGGLVRDPGYSSEVWNLTIPDLWNRTVKWRESLEEALPGHHIIAKIAWADSFASELKILGVLRNCGTAAKDKIQKAGITAMNVVRAAVYQAKNSVRNMNGGVQNMNTDPISVHNMNAKPDFLKIQRSQYEPIQEHVVRVFSLESESNESMKDSCPSEKKGEAQAARIDGQDCQREVKINFDLEGYSHAELGQNWVYVNRNKVDHPEGTDLVKACCIAPTPKMLRILLPGDNKTTLWKPEHVFYENGLGAESLYPVAVKDLDEESKRTLTKNQKAIKDALIDIMPLSGMEEDKTVQRFMSEVQAMAIRADRIGHSDNMFYLFHDYFYNVLFEWKPEPLETVHIDFRSIQAKWAGFLRWLEAGAEYPQPKQTGKKDTSSRDNYDYLDNVPEETLEQKVALLIDWQTPEQITATLTGPNFGFEREEVLAALEQVQNERKEQHVTA